MAKLPTLQGDRFTWSGRYGHTTLSRVNRFSTPAGGFYIKSHRTGALKLFLPDMVAMEENEFFDGEAQAYMCPGENVRVTIWVGE